MIEKSLNWEDITLCKYERLIKFLNDSTKLNDLDRTIEIYSILSDDESKSREYLLNLDLNSLNNELLKISFIKTPYKNKVPSTSYVIEGREYTIQLNLNNMNTAQYIDFQNLYKEYEKNFKYIFMCFLLPKGKKYGDGYDVIELAEHLYDKIPITIVTDIMVFFCHQLKALTVATLISSIRETKKILRKEKDPVQKYKWKRSLVQMRKTVALLQNEIEFAG